MTAIIGCPEVLQHATRLACMGVDVDPHRNEAATGDADLSSAAATVRSLVVPARGNLRIARQVMAVLASLEQPRSAASRR